jgi:hypothetical protein
LGSSDSSSSDGENDEDDDEIVAVINDFNPSEMLRMRAVASGCLVLNFIRNSTPETALSVISFIEVIRNSYGSIFPTTSLNSPKTYDANVNTLVRAARDKCFYGNGIDTKNYIKGHFLTTLLWLARAMPEFFFIDTNPYDILFSLPYYTTEEADAAVALAGELALRPIRFLNKIRQERYNVHPFLVDTERILSICLEHSLSVKTLEGDNNYDDLELFGRLHSMEESNTILYNRMYLNDPASANHVHVVNVYARLIGLANTLAANIGPWAKYPPGTRMPEIKFEIGRRALARLSLNTYNPEVGATRMFTDMQIATYLRTRALLLLFEKLYECATAGWFRDHVVWRLDLTGDDDN